MRLSGSVAGLLALGGCGRIDFDPASDAACAFGPFSAPVLAPGPIQTSGADWYPTPTADGLALYFYNFNILSGDFYIVAATRANTTDEFSAQRDLPELDTAMDEKAPTLTADERSIVFARHVPGISNLYEATRSSTAATFAPAVLLDAVTMSDTEIDPWLSPDGLRLMYSGATHIMESTRTDRSAPWQPPVTFSELDVGMVHVSPTLSADGLELFYSAGTMGQLDVYTSTRLSVTAPFAPPQVVPSLSSARDDVGLRLSIDGTTLYLNYDTLSGGGDDANIWIATRACL